MSTSTFHRPRSRDLVIALHCSGASAAQWRALEAKLGQSFAFAAPEHYDSGNAPAWRGGDTFTCADEAARSLALVDASDRKVHLMGTPMEAASHCTSRWRAPIASRASRCTSPPHFIC